MSIHPLQFHGITPPPHGSGKTLCPHCSHKREKHWQACLRVTETPGGWDVSCYHCGWAEWVAE